MPVPATINDLSPTESANSPAGTETPRSADNYLRAHASFIAQLRDGKTSAATLAGTGGAGMVGFDWAAIPTAINKVDWGIQTAANGVNVLRYIPPAEWATILAGTSTFDCGAAINTAFSSSGNSALTFPAGLFLSSVPLANLGKSATGAGWGKTIIRATASMPQLFTLTGQNQSVSGIFFDGANLATVVVLFNTNSNSSALSFCGVENGIVDGVRFPTTGNNNGAKVTNCLIRYNGRTYSTGTASVSAGGTVVTISGAADLTTLGFRVTMDFLKLGTQRAREIVSITANTVTVYPAFDTAETSVAYSLRQGSGVAIERQGNNSRVKIHNCTIQHSRVAGIDDRALYGASCIGNIIEVNEFGRLVGRRSVSDGVVGGEDISSYYEINPSGSVMFGGASGFEFVGTNSDAPLADLVYLPGQGEQVRVTYGEYDLREYAKQWINNATVNPKINSTNYVLGAIPVVVNLPDVPAATESGAGGVHLFHVRIINHTRSGNTLTIRSSTTVNGVAGATGLTVTGENRIFDCYWQIGYGWFVSNVSDPQSFALGPTGGIAAGGTQAFTITGVNCSTGKVIVSAYGGGENNAADAYLVGFIVTARTATGCTVTLKNLGGATQTLRADVLVVA